MKKPVQYVALDQKKHGVGGVAFGSKIQYRKQDRRAKPAELFAVVFFPRIKGLWPAQILHMSLLETLSHTPETAIAKFMDRRAPPMTWQQYQRAGHRVRKVRVSDLGDAPKTRAKRNV